MFITGQITHAQDIKKEVGGASPGMRICRLGLYKIVKSFGLCHIKRRNFKESTPVIGRKSRPYTKYFFTPPIKTELGIFKILHEHL